MPFPSTVKPNFVALYNVYKRKRIEYPHLKRITFAQWALECGWGKTDLATVHKNYGGAKWRKYMAEWATPISYEAHDGRVNYCHFGSDDKWIEGYWGRLDVEPAYKGWRSFTATHEEYIKFIGPIWVGTGEAGGKAYIRHVLQINDTLADLFKEDENEPQNINAGGSGSSVPWDRMLRDDDLKKRGLR